MLKAHLLTIGTEITAGEIVNSNAAWVSLQLEGLGVRVFSHLTVRDQKQEILKALNTLSDSDFLIVTGGLGPTSDDMTREMVAEWSGSPPEFDQDVWSELNSSYLKRGLVVREAHRHQCYFPGGSLRLVNPVGTAYGFALRVGSQQVFVLPGPPRELEGMWEKEVFPRLKTFLKQESRRWVRWTCLGVPESEVAELVEPIVSGPRIEVGYRAQIPYVKVKVYVDPDKDKGIVEQIENVLKPFVVARGEVDLGEELLRLWPSSVLEIVDEVTGAQLAYRMFEAQRISRRESPELKVQLGIHGLQLTEGIHLSAKGEELIVQVKAQGMTLQETVTLPFKTKLLSERGRRSATEWSIWLAVKALRARANHSST